MGRTLDREPRERVVAGLYTGPLGHLYSTVADILVLWTRWAAGNARTRIARRFSERSYSSSSSAS
jgi:hypothetical protein